MTAAQLQEWKNTKGHYITSQGGVVTVRDLDEYGESELHMYNRWQDSTKQITLGLYAQGTAYKAIPYKLSIITGQAPGDNAVRDWVRQFESKYRAPKVPL